MLKGLETLKLRVEAQSDNALKIASYYNDNPNIVNVIYPSESTHSQFELIKKQMEKGGTILTMVVKGGKEEVFKIFNELNLIDISNNLGDTKSLVTHPATTTHRVIGEEGRRKLNIPDNMIRLSIGLEDVDDLIEDIEEAFKQIKE